MNSEQITQTTRENGEQSAVSRTLLFVTDTEGFGGTEKHLLELVKRLDQPGVQPLILQLRGDVYTNYLKGSDVLYGSIISKKPRGSIWEWFQLFRNIQPDTVVFINGGFTQFPWYSFVAARFAGVQRCFAIHHLIAPPSAKKEGRVMRSDLGWLFRGWRVRLLVFASKLFCDATICVSNAVRDRLVSDYGFSANNTITIYNGVSVEEFVPSERNRASLRASLGLCFEDFVLVCVARLDEVKGLDILLLAIALVLGDGLCCKCIIVGDGPLSSPLREQAQTLGLLGHVFFEGFREDVRPYLQSADAFVLSSHQEGFPFAILEAMACGLPCIVTNVGGNAEAIIHNVHGLVVPPGSVDELAQAISYLVTHPRERANMSKLVRARVREAFDIEDRMADIKRVIKEKTIRG